ncbi:MAG TPA: hypothetical protein VF165_17520 [Nocardioidaceae bacterium]
MTSNQTSSTARGKRARAAERRSALAGKCRCGQDLDVCSREHCPRCGSTLRAG